MTNTTLCLLAIGLAMDAVAVSISSGLTIKDLKIFDAVFIALFFGLFQALMPLIGWIAGVSVKDLISDIDHWIAFVLLGFIGCKMILEAIKPDHNKKNINALNFSVLLILSVATSIDALAAGLSFGCLNVYIFRAITVIGIITFLLSLIGVFIGHKFGKFLEHKIEIVGGLLLIAIGVKILVDHMS